MWEHAQLKEDDIIQRTGTLLSDPLIFKDEYNADTVAIRFFVKREPNPLAIPGKLLLNLDKRIFLLKEGDEIKYHERKKSSILVFQKNTKAIFGLEDKEGVLMTAEQAFAHYRRSNVLVIILMAALLLAALYAFYNFSKL